MALDIQKIKLFILTLSASCVLESFLFVCDVHAFTQSEDALMESSVTEAKKRAQAFRAHKLQRKSLAEEAQRGAEESKQARRKAEEEYEKQRREFVANRPNPRANDQSELELELRDQARIEVQAEEMERARLDYRQKRAKVRRFLEREAYINEAREYGL